ncbi:MAG: superoxide dismutase family protein [Chthoniobacteraceae bacterium]
MDTPTKLTRRIMFATVLAGGLSLATLVNAQDDKDKKAHGAAHADHKMAEVNKAIAVLSPTEGNKAKGTVTFTKSGKGLKIVAELSGLTPGKHGFHIHEFGDVSAPDGTSAGGHFNPEGTSHGAPDADKRHAGDLGNIEADASGNAKLTLEQEGLGFEGAGNVLGRSVVVHAKEDDLKTQPTGDAGGRVGVGVIGVAK